MRYRWITIPTLALGMLALAVSDGLAQRGGPPGSSGGRGSYTPEDVWARYGGGSGDTIDLNKNPQAGMMMKMKGYSIPPDGIVRKSEFLPQVAARMQAMSGGGTPPGMGGPPPGMGGPPPAISSGGDKPAVILVPGGEGSGGPPQGGPPGSDRDRSSKDRDRDRGGPPSWGGSGRGEESRKVEEPEDERPNVLRYGKTPKELPSWFTELDSDKDAQIGLYEWHAATKTVEEFLEKDINGDGFLSADEVLKNPKIGSSDSKPDSRSVSTYGSKSSSTSSSKDDRSSTSSKSKSDKDKSDRPEKNDSKSSKDEKKSEPSSGSNPFLKK